jgi:hypothetical protein
MSLRIDCGETRNRIANSSTLTMPSAPAKARIWSRRRRICIASHSPVPSSRIAARADFTSLSFLSFCKAAKCEWMRVLSAPGMRGATVPEAELRC